MGINNKKILSVALSVIMATIPMVSAQTNKFKVNNNSKKSSFGQKVKKVVTHPGFYIPTAAVGLTVGLGVTYLTSVLIHNIKKYSVPPEEPSTNEAGLKDDKDIIRGEEDGRVIVRAGYNSLDESGKIVYNLILKKCQDLDFEFIRSTGNYSQIEIITKESELPGCNLPYNKDINVNRVKWKFLGNILDAIHYDNPEMFWITRADSICRDPYNEEIKICFYVYFGSKEDIIKGREEFERKVVDILSKIPMSATDYEKELFIHDYICKNCKYSYDGYNTSYDCLCINRTRCFGISEAYQVLMNRAGFDCRIIFGAVNNEFNSDSPTSSNHVWNIVKINGNWRHIDVTWDLPFWIQNVMVNGKFYYFVNLTTEEIQKNHRIVRPCERNDYENSRLPKEVSDKIK